MFLICNHIICEKCIAKKVEFGDRYNSVMCACGSLTYFGEDNEVVEEEGEGKDMVRNSNKSSNNKRI